MLPPVDLWLKSFRRGLKCQRRDVITKVEIIVPEHTDSRPSPPLDVNIIQALKPGAELTIRVMDQAEYYRTFAAHELDSPLLSEQAANSGHTGPTA